MNSFAFTTISGVNLKANLKPETNYNFSHIFLTLMGTYTSCILQNGGRVHLLFYQKMKLLSLHAPSVEREIFLLYSNT